MQENTRKTIRIAIDAGHGTNGDPGAIGPSGLKEADVTSLLAVYLENELKLAGITAWPTDRKLLSSARAYAAGEAGCSLLVSLHCNAAGSDAKGIETWDGQDNTEGEKLASALQESLITGTGAVDRGVKDDANWRPAIDLTWTGGMGILREFPGPACLVELLFISNPEEEKKLADRNFLLQAARSISQGVQTYLNYQPQEAPPRFPDIPTDLWQGKARAMVLTLAELGVVSGYEDGTFKPQQTITRLEAAALVYKSLAVLGKVPGV
jgi:N-acetylmuramoyl-L-alanine amidase